MGIVYGDMTTCSNVGCSFFPSDAILVGIPGEVDGTGILEGAPEKVGLSGY